MSRIIERGDKFASPPGGRWLRVGPVLMMEFHPQWWRFGSSFGKFYIGFYFGPFVLSLGQRSLKEIGGWTRTAVITVEERKRDD